MRKAGNISVLAMLVLTLSFAIGLLLPIWSGTRAEAPAVKCAFCIGVWPCYQGGCCCAEYYPGWCNCGAGCWDCWCTGSSGGFGGLCPGGPAPLQ